MAQGILKLLGTWEGVRHTEASIYTLEFTLRKYLVPLCVYKILYFENDILKWIASIGYMILPEVLKS